MARKSPDEFWAEVMSRWNTLPWVYSIKGYRVKPSRQNLSTNCGLTNTTINFWINRGLMPTESACEALCRNVPGLTMELINEWIVPRRDTFHSYDCSECVLDRCIMSDERCLYFFQVGHITTVRLSGEALRHLRKNLNGQKSQSRLINEAVVEHFGGKEDDK